MIAAKVDTIVEQGEVGIVITAKLIIHTILKQIHNHQIDSINK